MKIHFTIVNYYQRVFLIFQRKEQIHPSNERNYFILSHDTK